LALAGECRLFHLEGVGHQQSAIGWHPVVASLVAKPDGAGAGAGAAEGAVWAMATALNELEARRAASAAADERIISWTVPGKRRRHLNGGTPGGKADRANLTALS
jgi:hypothetical protein